MKKMKHMLVLTLVFAMLLSMAPMTTARAEETGTSDGVNTETELIDAIAVGGEITITGDIVLTQAVTISNNVTLKAESDVTITTSVVDVFTVTTGGVLTLGENITVNATNSILYANGGTVNVDGVTLISNHGSNALGFVNNKGTITVKSGTIESVWTGFTADNATLNITGGTIETSGSNAVIVRNNSTAVISGESVIETTGAYANLWVKTGGNLEIKGGTIKAAENQCAVSVEGANVTVSAGTFEKPVKANGEGTLQIKGGTFYTEPATEYVVTGYEATQNTDGTWTVAEKAVDDGINTEAELIDAIAAGGEITITGDITLTQGVTISNNVTLKAEADVTITTSVEDVFTVSNGGVLTLGEHIKVDATNSILYANGGTVNVEGATLISIHGSNALGFVKNNGTITVKSGTIESVWTGFTADNATLNINGGTIKTSGSNAVIVRNNSTAVISGESVIETTGAYANLWVKTGGNLEIKGGTIKAAENQCAVSVEGANVTVSAGTFEEPVKANGEGTLTIIGGTFAVDPSDYVDTATYAVTYAEEKYTVALPAAEEEETPAVDVEASETQKADAVAKFQEVFGSDVPAEDITVEMNTSLNVDEENASTDTSENTYTVDITATYEIVATSDNREVTVAEGTLDTAGKEVTVTVQLPDEFTPSSYVYVKHYKGSTLVGTYPVTVDANKKATFVNKDGFSTFEFYTQDTVDYTLIDVKHNLNLTSEIAFNFCIPKGDLASVAGLTATITHKHADGDKVISATWDGESNSNYYLLHYNGVAPAEITDTIELVVTDTNGDVVIEDSYSVMAYALQQINDSTADVNLQDAMRALLHYGAAAQTYFDYKADALANVGVAPAVATYTPITKTTSIKHNLNLQSHVDLSFFIEKTGEFTTNDGLTATIGGKTITEWGTVTSEGVTYWRLRYSWADPAEFEDELTLTITDSASATKLTDEYSVAAYADKQTDSALQTLMNALRIYGKAAANYFN